MLADLKRSTESFSALRVAAALVVLCLLTNQLAAQEVQLEAASGSPFGVGRMSLPSSWRGDPTDGLATGAFSLVERDGRALYPVFESRPVRAGLRNLLGRPQQVTVYFLFRGEEPLNLTLYSPDAIARRITPERDRRLHDELLEVWWREYTQVARQNVRGADYPPIVENYLTAMLARRLDLPAADLSRRLLDFLKGGSDELSQGLGILLGSESVRIAMQKETMLGGADAVEPLSVPLPRAVTPPPVEFPAPANDVKIEPIAMHVPVECFYVRFGKFSNYIWLTSLIDEWGGDLRNLVAVRGVSFGLNKKLERQIALKETAVSKLLGDQVIADVALIGQDTFLREGAAIGMLFQARNNFMLGTSILQQRAGALAADKSARQENVDINGHKVAFLSTPDNSIRSFYAVDGDYHLVTTSRAMVRQFYEAGQGKRSLGAAEEFRLARTLMPLSREDTAFIYLSDEFFRSLVGPKYRVEMTRRLKAAADLELMHMARLAARAEGLRSDSIEDFVRADLLPQGFAQRSDRSRPVLENGEIYDSLRGGRGTFAPIPDVEFDRITRSEAENYQRFADFYRHQWQRMDPVIVGLKRTPGEQPEIERLVMDIHIAPVALQKYGFLADWLGPPTRERFTPLPGDVMALEFVLNGQKFNGRDPHIFAGVRDFTPDYSVIAGEVIPSPKLDNSLQLYFGMESGQQLREKFRWPPEVPLDRDGVGRVSDNLWIRERGSLTVLSPNRDLLDDVSRQISPQDSDRPAQLRLFVGDVSRLKLTGFANTLAYVRARRSSEGNVRFMHTLANQFQIPVEDCHAVAESLLDAELIDPLGGRFIIEGEPGRLKTWRATSWQDNSSRIMPPPDYLAPPLQWFRGLNLDFAMDRNKLGVHAEIDMKRRPAVNGEEELPAPSAAR